MLSSSTLISINTAISKCMNHPSTHSINMDTLQKYQATTILFSFFASLLFFCFLLSWKRRTSNNSRAIPEPAGAWPLLGHLHMLLGTQLPHITLGAIADKYGPVFALRLGLNTALVVSNSEMAKECLATNDRVFATRPSLVAIKIMAPTMFGLLPYGPYWREVRKIAILELLSHRRLELLKQVRILEVNTSIKELYLQVCARTTVLVDMQGWFGVLTLNVSVRMVAGKRYFGASAKLDNNEAKRLQKAINEFFRLIGLFTVSDALPFLGWLDFQGHEKAMKRTADEVDGILGRWLEEHKQNHAEKAEGDRDFMDVMLSILGDEKLFGYEADAVNKSTCLNLILGGTDTTSATLTWALCLLLNNRHALKKAQDEIDIHVGKHKYVEESDIEKLVYLQAIVKETLRLYPATPLLVPHEATEDCTVAGYGVPKGTRLIVNAWKIQRDPNIWPNPSEFQPLRFLTTHADVDVRGQHFGLIPFSSGRRTCPGISFALQVVHLTLARLLQGFDFETPSGGVVDMTGSVGLSNKKATPLQVLITPRLPPNLYT